MKKWKKIVLTVLLLFFFFLCCIILFQEFRYAKSIFEKLSDEPYIFIIIHFVSFSFLSFLFAILKFSKDVSVDSLNYKILRICDFIFSISLFCLLILGLYDVLKNIYSRGTIQNRAYFGIAILLFLLAISIVLFINNIRYHKTLKKSIKPDIIDEIGV